MRAEFDESLVTGNEMIDTQHKDRSVAEYKFMNESSERL